MAENQFTSTIESLFKGLDQFVTTKTVVGEPVQVGETIIIPLIDVTCGMAAGAFAEGAKQKQRGGGGMSAKMSPSAVLVIQGGVTKLVEQDTGRISRIAAPKYPYDYLQRLSHVCAQKEEIAAFFAAHP